MKPFTYVVAIVSIMMIAACNTTTPSDPSINEPAAGLTEEPNTISYDIENGMSITPIQHATAILRWGNRTIYSDPTGGPEAFANQPSPDIVFITDIHGDHLSVDTLQAVLTENTVLVIPQAVADELPENLSGTKIILANGETTKQLGFSIEAIPMYNLPESDDSRHTKGRGNGYVFEKDGKRVYFSGDTADIQEMRDLKDIDVAFVCMNLPYTMSIEDAAGAVLAFKPKKVFPYHYRGENGLSDVDRFKRLINFRNPDIEVIQLNWYQEL